MTEVTVTGVVRASAPAVPAASRRRLRVAGSAAMLVAFVTCVVLFRADLPDPGALWRDIVHAGPGWLACAVAPSCASMMSPACSGGCCGPAAYGCRFPARSG